MLWSQKKEEGENKHWRMGGVQYTELRATSRELRLGNKRSDWLIHRDRHQKVSTFLATNQAGYDWALNAMQGEFKTKMAECLFHPSPSPPDKYEYSEGFGRKMYSKCSPQGSAWAHVLFHAPWTIHNTTAANNGSKTNTRGGYAGKSWSSDESLSIYIYIKNKCVRLKHMMCS